MGTRPLIYDPRIKKNILLTENPNPALILLDILLKIPGLLRAQTLEEVMVRCSRLADFCDERVRREDDGR